MKIVGLIGLGMLLTGCVFSQIVTGFNQAGSKNDKALNGTYELLSDRKSVV